MSVAIVDARRLADMHALYRMFDDRGRLLYVGITGDLGKRLGDHSFKRWFPLVERITLEWLPNRAAALVAEKRAIGAERPRYNRAGLQPPRSVRTGKATPAITRDILADLGEVMRDERERLSVLPGRLRQLAPAWEPYQKMTGARLSDELKRKGVRVTRAGNVMRLDPADLRRVRNSGPRPLN